MYHMTRCSLSCLALGATLLLAPGSSALEDISFGEGLAVSEDGLLAQGGAIPGGSANKGKLVKLVKTPGAVNDGRLVIVYADANSEHEVWHPKGGLHKARDIFARYSDDEGASWSDPVNLSNSAQSYSAIVDSDGDGVAETYWGDSGKATIFNNGNTVVISWTDKYCPEPDWAWGTSDESSLQGVAFYPDIAVYPNQHEVPFSCTMLAVSTDGGASWTYGGDNPPLQLTYGRRDALQDVHRGSGARWVVTWQEDPEGLQPGYAEGPGDGSSGATVSKGTDIWYSWADDIVNDAAALRTNRVPLSNNSQYDLTSTNGFPLVGTAGSVENHGSSRANLFLLKDGSVFKAIAAYEETKGIPDVLEGKTIQYHAFPYDQPVTVGELGQTNGDAGVTLTDFLANSRRVRFVVQPPDGVVPALAIFWKEGYATQGGPSDIRMKVSTSVDPLAVAAAPTLNLSAETPNATMSSLDLGTEVDALEDARAHRAYLRGNQLIIGYSYTWNGPLARYTTAANYDFWLRRSLDGGLTWSAPQNLSNLPDTSVNVLEPRLVGPSKTGQQDDAAFIVAWGTETNVYEGIEESVALDVQITRSLDQGETFEAVRNITGTANAEFESQLRVTEDCGKVYAVWMSNDGTRTDAMFGISSPWQDLGSSLGGAQGVPSLRGAGSFEQDTVVTIELSNAPASSMSVLFLSLELTPTPFLGGVLLPFPNPIVRTMFTDDLGLIRLGSYWPVGSPVGLRTIAQFVIVDAAAPEGAQFSNGLAGTSR